MRKPVFVVGLGAANISFLLKFAGVAYSPPPSRLLSVCKISTYFNPADMMTKPVLGAKFELYSNLVGIIA
jgi:hypothetical protein